MKQNKTGVVVGLVGQKTVKVSVSTLKKHDKYKKIMNLKKNYICHCEVSNVSVGDKVDIEASKPISKTKNWLVVKKIS